MCPFKNGTNVHNLAIFKKVKTTQTFWKQKTAKEAVLTVKTMKKSAWKKLAYVV